MKTVKRKKIKNIEPYTLKWEKMANQLARSWAPPIHPCRECGYPVLSGYCCGTCGSNNP
jgi:hypothetical protein